MIDGRGQVRITDFGLAAFAREIPLSDLRSGTPAYMAPEQKAGKEVHGQAPRGGTFESIRRGQGPPTSGHK